MCTVCVIVLTVVGLSVQTLAGEGQIHYTYSKTNNYIKYYTIAAECENGTVRFDPDQDLEMGPHAGYVQLCINNEWNDFCGENFNRVEANVFCKQLGYLGSKYCKEFDIIAHINIIAKKKNIYVYNLN